LIAGQATAHLQVIFSFLLPPVSTYGALKNNIPVCLAICQDINDLCRTSAKGATRK
jgi:hypothetical protein